MRGASGGRIHRAEGAEGIHGDEIGRQRVFEPLRDVRAVVAVNEQNTASIIGLEVVDQVGKMPAGRGRSTNVLCAERLERRPVRVAEVRFRVTGHLQMRHHELRPFVRRGPHGEIDHPSNGDVENHLVLVVAAEQGTVSPKSGIPQPAVRQVAERALPNVAVVVHKRAFALAKVAGVVDRVDAITVVARDLQQRGVPGAAKSTSAGRWHVLLDAQRQNGGQCVQGLVRDREEIGESAHPRIDHVVKSGGFRLQVAAQRAARHDGVERDEVEVRARVECRRVRRDHRVVADHAVFGKMMFGEDPDQTRAKRGHQHGPDGSCSLGGLKKNEDQQIDAAQQHQEQWQTRVRVCAGVKNVGRDNAAEDDGGKETVFSTG